MRADLLSAKAIMEDKGYTCVLCLGDVVLSDTRRGITPLLSWLDSGKNFNGYCAADKVVGKAAAMLYVLMGVGQVYAEVMSRPAAEVLEVHGIDAFSAELTDRIVNRFGTGLCPMESAVMDITSPEQAEIILRQKVAKMQQK